MSGKNKIETNFGWNDAIRQISEHNRKVNKEKKINEPLPCPFCGEEEIEVVREGSTNASRIVSCTNCGCSLETNEVKSWEQWNTRK